MKIKNIIKSLIASGIIAVNANAFNLDLNLNLYRNKTDTASLTYFNKEKNSSMPYEDKIVNDFLETRTISMHDTCDENSKIRILEKICAKAYQNYEDFTNDNFWQGKEDYDIRKAALDTSEQPIHSGQISYIVGKAGRELGFNTVGQAYVNNERDQILCFVKNNKGNFVIFDKDTTYVSNSYKLENALQAYQSNKGVTSFFHAIAVGDTYAFNIITDYGKAFRKFNESPELADLMDNKKRNGICLSLDDFNFNLGYKGKVLSAKTGMIQQMNELSTQGAYVTNGRVTTPLGDIGLGHIMINENQNMTNDLYIFSNLKVRLEEDYLTLAAGANACLDAGKLMKDVKTGRGSFILPELNIDGGLRLKFDGFDAWFASRLPFFPKMPSDQSLVMKFPEYTAYVKFGKRPFSIAGKAGRNQQEQFLNPEIEMGTEKHALNCYAYLTKTDYSDIIPEKRDYGAYFIKNMENAEFRFGVEYSEQRFPEIIEHKIIPMLEFNYDFK